MCPVAFILVGNSDLDISDLFQTLVFGFEANFIFLILTYSLFRGKLAHVQLVWSGHKLMSIIVGCHVMNVLDSRILFKISRINKMIMYKVFKMLRS